MLDNNDIDEKIIAIPFGDPWYNKYQDIYDLPTHVFNEIKHFFEVYKQLEDKNTRVENIVGRDEAIKAIIKCMEDYEEKFPKNGDE
jgi:inorganic pyrophosphatase